MEQERSRKWRGQGMERRGNRVGEEGVCRERRRGEGRTGNGEERE